MRITLPPQPVRAAGWQPALWISVSFEPPMNADGLRYNAANLRLFAFICGANSLIYLSGDHKLILTGYSQVSPNRL